MPDAGLQQQTPKRPSIASRHSSTNSLANARSPNESVLSSSGNAQRSKASRHIVGGAHARGRMPSYSRGAKQNMRPEEIIGQALNPKGHVKRNSSNIHLTRNPTSTTNLRKNHSETSLKRNKSGAQLAPLAKLGAAHSGSSKHLSRAAKQKSKRSSVASPRSPQDVAPTVRFDLGDDDGGGDDGEDAWEEASQSQPSTKASTRRNSLAHDNAPSRVEQSPVEQVSEIDQKSPLSTLVSTETLPQPDPVSPAEKTPPKPQHGIAQGLAKSPMLQPAASVENETADVSQMTKSMSTPHLGPFQDEVLLGSPATRTRPHGRRGISDRNSITNKLLSRNVSFTAPPEVSSVSASVIGSAHTSPTSTRHSGSEIVSRFINGISSSGATRSSYLAQRQLLRHDSNEEDKFHKNTSNPSFARFSSRASSSLSGTATPTTAWSQQENIPPSQRSPQKGPGRRVRLSAESMPSFSVSETDYYGPKIGYPMDSAEIEYRRIRLFHNPLADSIDRVQQTSPPQKSSRADPPKSPLKPSLLAQASNEGRSILSTSWRSNKSDKGGKSSSVETVRKPRVTFQGLKSRDEPDHPRRRSIDDDDFDKSSAARDEIREICKRLWEHDSIVQGVGANED